MAATEGTLNDIKDRLNLSTGLPVAIVGGSVNIEATLEIRGESINATMTNWAGMSGMPVSANITGGSVSIEATLEIRGESINATVTNWNGIRGESINVTVANTPTVTVSSLRATGITQYLIGISNHDTEYLLSLPAGTKQLNISNTSQNITRFSFGESTCGVSVAPYWLIPAGSEKQIDDINLTGITMYFAVGTSATTVQVLCYV